MENHKDNHANIKIYRSSYNKQFDYVVSLSQTASPSSTKNPITALAKTLCYRKLRVLVLGYVGDYMKRLRP